MESLYENKEICSKCGGRCCKKSGCVYSPKDFKDTSFKALLAKLEEGNISITSTIKFQKLKNGILFPVIYLYLRARNIDRPVVDLLSLKSGCSKLSSTGCEYNFDSRPYYGKTLIPGEVCKNPELINAIPEWQSYQKVLSKLVKCLTGFTVEEKIKDDVENLIYNLSSNNTEGVNKEEIEEIKTMIPLLSKCYPESVINGYERFERESKRKKFINKL